MTTQKTKCIKYPNRTKERVFKSRDVGRIAAYAIEDGAFPLEVAARVLISCGYGEIICTASRVFDQVNLLISFLVKVAGIGAVTRLLDFLLRLLGGLEYAKLPKWNLVGLIVAVALSVMEKIFSLIKELLDSATEILAVSELLKELCKTIDIIEGQQNGKIN